MEYGGLKKKNRKFPNCEFLEIFSKVVNLTGSIQDRDYFFLEKKSHNPENIFQKKSIKQLRDFISSLMQAPEICASFISLENCGRIHWEFSVLRELVAENGLEINARN